MKRIFKDNDEVLHVGNYMDAADIHSAVELAKVVASLQMVSEV